MGTALLAPAIATGLGLVLQPGRELGAISIYLLGVVIAAGHETGREGKRRQDENAGSRDGRDGP